MDIVHTLDGRSRMPVSESRCPMRGGGADCDRERRRYFRNRICNRWSGCRAHFRPLDWGAGPNDQVGSPRKNVMTEVCLRQLFDEEPGALLNGGPPEVLEETGGHAFLMQAWLERPEQSAVQFRHPSRAFPPSCPPKRSEEGSFSDCHSGRTWAAPLREVDVGRES